MTYQLSFRLEPANPRDLAIYDFLSHYPSRTKGKREFILDAIYSAMTMENVQEFHLMSKEIRKNLTKVQETIQQLPKDASTVEKVVVLTSQPESINVGQTSSIEKPAKPMLAGNVEQVMESLKAQAFE